MSTKIKSEDFKVPQVGEGLYEAELKEVKDISDGQYGKRVAFIYKLSDKEVELAYVCYKTKATEDNKLGKALIAHGIDIADGNVDTDNLPKKAVRVLVEDYESERNVDGKKEKFIGSTISKVKPLIEVEKVKV